MLYRQQPLTRVGTLDAKLGSMIIIIISLIRNSENCRYCGDGFFRTTTTSTAGLSLSIANPTGYWYDKNNCNNWCGGCGGCSCGGGCPACGCIDDPEPYLTCCKLIYIKSLYRGYH